MRSLFYPLQVGRGVKTEYLCLAGALRLTQLNGFIQAGLAHPFPEHMHAIRAKGVSLTETISRQCLPDIDGDMGRGTAA